MKKIFSLLITLTTLSVFARTEINPPDWQTESIVPANWIATLTAEATKKIDLFKTTLQVRYMYASKFGAVGDGVTDNTKALQAGINATAGTGYVLKIDVPGVYKFDKLTLPNGWSIEGLPGRAVTLSAITYNSQNKTLLAVGSAAKDGALTDVVLDGGISYDGNGNIAADSRIKDSLQTMLFLNNGNNYNFKNVRIANTMHGVLEYNAKNINYLSTSFDSIGRCSLYDTYGYAVENIVVQKCWFSSGWFDWYNAGLKKVQEGDDDLCMGGQGWLLKEDTFFNGAKRYWFVAEGRCIKDVTFQNCLFDMNGIETGGLSIGGLFGSTNVANRTLHNYRVINCVYKNVTVIPFRPRDYYLGKLKYMQFCYQETWGCEDCKFSGNTYQNVIFSLSLGSTNVEYSNNTIVDSTLLHSKGDAHSGGDILFTIGIQAGISGQKDPTLYGRSDSTQKTKIAHNIIYMNHQGQVIRFPSSRGMPTTIVDGFEFTDNKLYCNGELSLYKISQSSLGNHINISISNNVAFVTKPGIAGFYENINENTNNQFNLKMSGNDFSHTQWDTGHIESHAQQSAKWNVEGTTFKGNH